MIISIIPIVIILLFLVLFILFVDECIEIYKFNNGICRKCGSTLDLYERNQKSYRIYKCEHCSNKVKIRNSLVDKMY